MAVSKLTHATANIFMEQSLNDCLCNLGSTRTLVSEAAPSSIFPTPFPANLVPAGSPAQLGSHQEQEHQLLQDFPPSYQSSLHWGLQSSPLHLQSRSISSLPSRCLPVSQGLLNTEPLLTILPSELLGGEAEGPQEQSAGR